MPLVQLIITSFMVLFATVFVGGIAYFLLWPFEILYYKLRRTHKV